MPATPVRETKIRADIYTKDVTLIPDEKALLYLGDVGANRFHITLVNQGQPVDTSGYQAILRYVMPDSTVVLDKAMITETGELSFVVPLLVYQQVGNVLLHITMIDSLRVSTAFALPIKVLDRKGLEITVGADVGGVWPTPEEVFQMVQEIEYALSLIGEGEGASETIGTRLKNLEDFKDRPQGFATIAQAKDSVQAEDYTPEKVLGKVKEVDGEGSGLDADLLDGQQGAYYAKQTDMSAQSDALVTLIGQAVRRALVATINIPTTGWTYDSGNDRYWLHVLVPGLTSGMLRILTIDQAKAGPKVPVYGTFYNGTGSMALLAADIPSIASTAVLWGLEVG